MAFGKIGLATLVDIQVDSRLSLFCKRDSVMCRKFSFAQLRWIKVLCCPTATNPLKNNPLTSNSLESDGEMHWKV